MCTFGPAAGVARAQDVAELSIEWMDTSGLPVNIVYYSPADAVGRRLREYWWDELFDAQMTENFICGHIRRACGCPYTWDPAAPVGPSWCRVGPLHARACGRLRDSS